jgi:acyl carrier protein
MRADVMLAVMRLDLPALQRAAAQPGAVPPVFKGLVRGAASAATAGPVASTKSEWAEALASMSRERQLEAAEELVRTEAANILSLPGGKAVPREKLFKEMGVDSLMAVELRNVLMKRVGSKLPATVVFDHPTSAALAKYLLEKLEVTQSKAKAVRVATAVDEPIAIVGMGCRYPGGVDSPESFWSLLDNGVDAITEVPKERWDA